MKKALRFVLTLQSVPVTLVDDKGKEMSCELRELNGTQRDQYLKNNADRVKLDDKGNYAGMKDYDGIQADLLVTCFYIEGKLATKAFIQSMPGSAIQELYDEAKRMSKLQSKDEREAEEKKDTPETTAKNGSSGASSALGSSSPTSSASPSSS